MGKAVSHRILEILLDLLKMSAALLIVAASVYFFLIPSGTSVSSISGLAIILRHFTGRSISELTMLLNIALLLLGFLTWQRIRGKDGLRLDPASAFPRIFRAPFSGAGLPHGGSDPGCGILHLHREHRPLHPL